MATVQIQFRGGTAASATAANPILAERELAIETDTHLFKIGDGVTRWNDLPYGGLKGEKGDTGSSAIIVQRVATVDVLKGEPLCISGSNAVKLADNNTTLNDAFVLGLAMADANAGETVNVLIQGIINDSMFNVFPFNTNIFLDINGGLTDIKPAKPNAKFICIVGRSLGNGDVLVSIQHPIFL